MRTVGIKSSALLSLMLASTLNANAGRQLTVGGRRITAMDSEELGLRERIRIEQARAHAERTVPDTLTRQNVRAMQRAAAKSRKRR